MAKITVRKSDVVWNYIGTAVSMASGFALIPLLLLFLSAEQVGLWYVFVALTGFAQLLEFGFTSTLSRNILYCLSGARKLTKQGCDADSVEPGVDWHLLRVVLRTSKTLYAIMGVVGFSLSATLGTLYVEGVTDGFSVEGSFASWCVFAVSVFTNLYVLYCVTFLRGIGDVAGENKARTMARLAQLAITAILLFAGFGLLAAAIGFFMNSVLLWTASMMIFRSHADVQEGLKSDHAPLRASEMKSVLSTISFVAWRDGIVSLAWYGATQAASLISSTFLGLTETATYSVMLQFVTGIYNFASAYIRSCFPSFQSAYVARDLPAQRQVVERGMFCYVAMFAASIVCVEAVLPALAFFREGFVCDPLLFLGLAVYCFLLNQHSLFCCLIVSMNEIPYFKAYLVSTVFGVALSCVLCGVANMGAWGLVLGQAIPQLVYNNWRWPKYLLDKVGASYLQTLFAGARWWFAKIKR